MNSEDRGVRFIEATLRGPPDLSVSCSYVDRKKGKGKGIKENEGTNLTHRGRREGEMSPATCSFVV